MTSLVLALTLSLSADPSPAPTWNYGRKPLCSEIKRQWNECLERPEHYTFCVKHLWADLKACNKTLADIGETSGSMEGHRDAADCKVRVMPKRDLLYRGTSHYRMVAIALGTELRKCGLALKDIGLSTRKLNYLQVANCYVYSSGDAPRESLYGPQVRDYVVLQGGVTKALPPLHGECRHLQQYLEKQVATNQTNVHR